MSASKSIFHSVVGRRFFLLFLGIAFLPVFIITALSYQGVTSQLKQQTIKSLQRNTKSLGMGIHQRLNFLETEIGVQLNKRDTAEQIISYNFEDEMGKRLKRKFKNLAWFDTEGNSSSIHGRLEKELVIDITESLSLQTQPFQLKEYFDDFGHIHLLAIGVFTEKNTQNTMYLIGDIDPDYLWRTDILSDDETSCVFTSKHQMLYCSKLDGEEFLEAFIKNQSVPHQGHFEWQKHNQKYISKSWEIFLGDYELVNNWTIVLSKSQKSVFKTLEAFKVSFPAVMLLTLILIILLSMKYLKTILTPLEKLKEGADRLSQRDFSSPIEIATKDEFSELATSFNDMSDELSKKFSDLETLSKIDSLIVTVTETDLLIKKLMEVVIHKLHSDMICIAIFDEFSENQEIHILDSETKAETRTTSINIPDNEKQYFFEHPEGVTLNPTDSHFEFLLLPGIKAMSSALLFPILIDSKLAALTIVMYENEVEAKNSILESARIWIDKIVIAMTKTAWQEKLYHQAHYDALTDLPNRVALQDFLHNAMLRADACDSKLSVLFIDLDRFKMINDSLGHLLGDQYLKIIADRINRCLKSTDMVSRFGGDEFTIVLTDLGNDKQVSRKINRVALRILEAVSEPVFIEEQELYSACSIGAVVYPDDAETTEDLLKNADSAMYHAKSKGGSNLKYFSNEMNSSIKKKLQVETSLRKSIDNNQLEIYLQPQVDAKDLSLVGAEALVRWRHPELGLVPPSQFISIAEQTNLICDIDLCVFEKAVIQLKAWQQQQAKIDSVSVNFSSKLIQQEEVVGKVWKILNRHKIDASQLVIEITESALIQDFDKTISNMEALIKLGFSFAIDDFGTGYSSLTYLKSLPVKKLKIDQSFIFNIDKSKADLSIVKSTIFLCKDLGILSVAEGVETDLQLASLQNMQCDQIQGYLIAKPMPVDEFTDKFLKAPLTE